MLTSGVIRAIAARAMILGATAVAFPQEVPTFQSGVNLVLMDVSVTDSKGAPVAGLNQSQFEVKENRAIKSIARFEPGSGNISLVLVTDYSGSMRPRREALFRGVAAF